MSDPSIDQTVEELKRAAKDLATASARLSQRLLEKAGTAAKDPKGTARRAAETASHELDAAANEIRRLLRDL
jgi:signal transduction histidine kinase